MKNLLLCSPWNNKWMGYYQKFFAPRYEVHSYHNDFGFKRREDFDAMVQEHKNVEWADIVLFNWADPFLEYWSNQPKPQGKKYVAVLRSYEIFNTTAPWVVNWDQVDHLIFVNKAVQEIFLKNVEHLIKKPFKTPTHFIPNGIDLDQWPYRQRQPDAKIAWVAGLNYKKGVELLMQFAHRINGQYSIELVGDTGDLRTCVYFEHLRKELGLESKLGKCVHCLDVPKFLADKSFLLVTSMVEGHPNAVLEAMAVGIKPLIHNFPGSKDLFPREYIWNTIEDAVQILQGPYCSSDYREFVSENYDMNKVYPRIEELF